MPRAPRYTEVKRVISERIEHGDYLLGSIPGERTIAADVGVSHMTARKAVQELIAEGILCRRENGALAVHPDHGSGGRTGRVAMLVPAFSSPYLSQLTVTVQRAARTQGVEVRPVQYVHWNDPSVIEALSQPTGSFIIPVSTDAPDRVVELMRTGRCVSIDIDLSDRGVPSVRLFPDAHGLRLLDHLSDCGFDRLHCVSSHHQNAEINRRIGIWRDWQGRHGAEGELWSRPAPSFEHPAPFARSLVLDLLDGVDLRGSALMATTFPAAIGAARACWERGLMPGRDVRIASFNIEDPARFMTPAMTGLDIPDLTPLLGDCLDWFDSGKPWPGSLRLEPERCELFLGESTRGA